MSGRRRRRGRWPPGRARRARLQTRRRSQIRRGCDAV